MVNQVNNIIYNTLVRERAILLPGIGILCVVRRSAAMASKESILPPTYIVEFSSQGVATSLVDIIAHEGKIEAPKAEEIYARWLEKVRTESTLTIEGVGRLQHKSFVVQPAFIALFNPADNRPVKFNIKRRKGGLVASIIIVLVAAIGALGYYFIDDIKALFEANTPEESAVVITAEASDIVEVESEVMEDIVVDTQVVTQQDEAPLVPVQDINKSWTSDIENIRHWVVAGSYSTQQNANIAKSDLEAKHDGVECHIFPMGRMYAVAVYGSIERDACEEFMRNHRKELESMWIFTPKKYK